VLLVAIAVVPIAGLAAYLLYESAQRDLQQSASTVRQMAARVADRAQRQVDDVRVALERIAHRPLVRAMNPDTCDPALAELRELYPRTVNILTVDPEGRILCAAIPPARNAGVLRISDTALLEAMRAKPEFRISRPLVGRINQRWAVTAVQPVVDESGKFVGTVSMGLDLLTWFSFAGIEGLGDDAVAALLTTDGIVVARSAEADKWIGRDVSAGGTHQAAMAVKEGTARAKGTVGIDRLWAFDQVGGTPWYATAGVATERVYAGARRRAMQAVLLLVLAVIAAATAGSVLVARLLRPLQAARESEARYRQIADSSPDATLIHSEYRVVLVNPAMVQLLGATDASQLLGKPSTMMLAPQSVEGARERIGRLYAGETLPRAEQVYLRLDGTPVEVEISSAPIVFDGKPAAHVTVRDISERRRADEDLRRFRAAMDISGDAVLLIDRATLRYVDVNRTFCELVGYAREEVLGMTPMDLFSADRATLERDYDAIIADNSAAASKVEGWYRRKDGTKVPIETRRRALRTRDGWIIVGTARDIRERREADAKISRLNRVHAVLSGINAAIVRIRDRHELFDEACRIAADAGGFTLAWVGLVEHDGHTVVPVAWRGAEAARARISGKRYSLRSGDPEHAGIIAEMVETGRAVVVNDVAGDPRIRRKAELAAIGVQSVALFPLHADGGVLGLLALQAGELGFFDEQEVKLLQELAGDISFALEHIEKTERVDYLAYYDELTELANRRLFVERLTQFVHAAAQTGEKLALVVADVERLRFVNDSLGRQSGDAVLRTVAARLAAGADRAEIGRLAADDFGIVMRDVKGRSAVLRRFGRLWQECFGSPMEAGGTDLRISARAGIAMFPANGVDGETLMRAAEAALRRAKQSGERQVFHAAEMTERTAEKLSMENRLRRALERDEFVLHYQPKLDVETRRIVGVEALIRWQNPDMGLVPPGQFIPLMEETGIILDVGAWALRRAVEDHRRWTDLDVAAPRVAVNVSAVQLRKKDYVATLQEALRAGTRVPGVDLEITESLVMDDIQGNIEKLQEVRKLGVGISIDDFGTGYSSLAYLARLPVQALKIDRSFIITMLAKPDTMTLVSTMISLAHSLKLKVVAEGVDSEEQAKMLRLLRCDEVQGFLFSRPLPFDDLTALLRRQ
jgi:diguanylate cyclase (GGDEF)-like protein/PAS domain S-box-containing protein